MSRFGPALRRVAAELDLPPGARAAILLEMAADLEAVYEHHVKRGAGEGAAARLAEETVLGSSDVVRRLSKLHQESWRGWSESVGARLGRGVDLVLLLAGVLPVFAVAGFAAVRAAGAAGGPLAYLLVGTGAVMAGLIAFEWGRLLGGGRGRGGARPALLVLSAVAPALGGLALALGLYVVAADLSAGPAAGAQAGAVAERLAGDGALLLAGLLLGVAGALSWFVLLSRAAAQAAREVDALLGEGASGEAAGRGRGRVLSMVRRRQA